MYYFIAYMLFNVRDTQFRQTQSSMADFAIVAKDGLFRPSIEPSSQLIYDVTWTWGTSIVTSFSSIVLVRVNRPKGDLH